MVNKEIAIFGAGCFWGVEDAFAKLDGVLETAVGYMGGSTKDPSYEEVCTNTTGHVEVVKISFDSDELSFENLLDVFWKIHDPTQYNRQGPDIGTQYKSVIFYQNLTQKNIAEKSKENHQKTLQNDKMIVTEILPASVFYRAEEYHQQYFKKNGQTGCLIK